MQKLKTQKGITLIALVITIIVMLILVGVTVTVALNGGLFTTAKQATDDTTIERDKEQTLASGRIKVGNKWYDSLEDYQKGIESANQEETAGGTATTPDGGATTETLTGNWELGDDELTVVNEDGVELAIGSKVTAKSSYLYSHDALSDGITYEGDWYILGATTAGNIILLSEQGAFICDSIYYQGGEDLWYFGFNRR